MTTLQNLRTLLNLALIHADNPALSRCGRTVEGVAVEYLGATLAEAIRLYETEPLAELYWLRMDKPAKVHALLVALALAHGLDPGVGGIGVSWRPDGPGWRMEGVAPTLQVRGCVWYENRDQDQLDDKTDPAGGDGPLDSGHTLYLHAPSVANEPNPIAALEAAVKHTLEQG